VVHRLAGRDQKDRRRETGKSQNRCGHTRKQGNEEVIVVHVVRDPRARVQVCPIHACILILSFKIDLKALSSSSAQERGCNKGYRVW
jgi:hypothetical protein